MNRGTDRSPNLDYDNSPSGGAGAPFVGAPHPAGSVQEGTTGRLPAAGGNVPAPGQVAPAFNVGGHGGGAPTGLSHVCVPNLGWQGYPVAGAASAGWNPFMAAGMIGGTLPGPHLGGHQVPGSGQAGAAVGGAPGTAGAGTGVAAGDQDPPPKRGRPKGRTDQSPRAKLTCRKCKEAGGLLHRTCPGGSGRGKCTRLLPTSGTAQEEEETHYVEEIAWRESPCPRPITGEETKPPPPLPLPPPPPMAAVRAPSPPTKHCVWSFDEGSRVLEANFRVPGTVLKATDTDKAFLFQMYERDDISVVTEGLADRCDPYVFSMSYIKDRLGHVRHHKFRLFKTQTPQTDEPTQPTVLPEETKDMHSMTFADYAVYLERRRCLASKRKCTEANCPGAVEGAVKKQKRPATEANRPGAVNGAVNLTDGNEKDRAVYFRDEKEKDHLINVEQDSLYMLDVDVNKLLYDAFLDFQGNFLLPEVLPGGSQCMMNVVTDQGRPFMGPNLYVAPPPAFTHLHQDGLGTVDSGHLCLSGCNEVVMLRRLTEERKCHAIQLLTGVDEEVAHSILYGLPHNNKSRVLAWPTNEQIEACEAMGYCPSVFVLKPGQMIHINKGRLHMFRKMGPEELHKDDCHAKLREAARQEGKLDPTEEEVCRSVAWDWNFLGVTPAGINREVSSVLECAALVKGCGGRKEGLAIPETSLMGLAMRHIEMVQRKGACTVKKERSYNVLKGIQACLEVIVEEHMAVLRLMVEQGSVDVKEPQASENPAVATVDPYAVTGYQCELCLQELANAYYHCVGCEEHLDKDFNICAACYGNKEYLIHRQVSLRQNYPSTRYNHRGGLEGESIRTITTIDDEEDDDEVPTKKKARKTKKAPKKKKAPENKRKEDKSECGCKQEFCDICKYCTECSCKCHNEFKACFRFMTIDMVKERQLSERVADIVGEDKVDHFDQTRRRLRLARAAAVPNSSQGGSSSAPQLVA